MKAKSVVHPLQRVPVAPKGKLSKDVERPQSIGILEKVTEPTRRFQALSLCKNHSTLRSTHTLIHVCLHLKDLNKCLLLKTISLS